MGLFSKVQNYKPNVGRNVFDLSFANNLTFKFGQLTPCVCQEVLPGDSFRIKSAFGLRFMPTYFPLQTRIRADVHFFYVRNRNLWTNWQRFITQSSLTDGQTPPVFPTIHCQNLGDQSRGTFELGDYLGLPTTIDSSLLPELVIGSNNLESVNGGFYPPYSEVDQFKYPVPDLARPNYPIARSVIIRTSSIYQGVSGDLYITLVYEDAQADDSIVVIDNLGNYYLSPRVTKSDSGITIELDNVPLSYHYQVLVYTEAPISSFDLDDYGFTPSPGIPVSAKQFYNVLNRPANVNTGEAILPVSALPFRAYESIYNAFYRDERVNPLVDGTGKILYNKWLVNDGDGVDSFGYDFHFRNWEQDFLTSCVTSPQQGVAPLVGISSLGTMTFGLSDGSTYSVEPVLADDGNTIINAKIGTDTPDSVRRALVDYVSSGISINDFRNVNALQRWLEANIRKGYKYRDQIVSHFGVEPRFDVMDMPEFLGGFSQMIDTSQINQSVDTADSPLGSYAGQLSCVGESRHDINVSCDEHGFIIGILSVVPVPTYSQLLAKYFLKTQPLDYFFPEFGHIGMQPINYSEAFPLLVPYTDNVSNDQSSLAQTFGYQRAWYDYLQNVDQVHGEFRTSLRDFVMFRNFTSLPKLNSTFTVIDPNQINDVFSVTLNDDKILGQMYFDIKAVRPIPRYGIPKLE